MQTNETDAMFMAIANKVGSIDNLLDSFFEFLHRKTDFYMVIPDNCNQAKMGFRDGIAESKVLKSFRHYPKRFLENNAETENTKKTSSQNMKQANESKQLALSECTSKASDENTINLQNEGLKSNNSNYEQVPMEGNGGVTKNYSWSQTLDELNIVLPLPTKIPSSSSITCTIQPTNISIHLEDTDQFLLKGTFPANAKVVVSESFWTMDQDAVQVSLQKVKESWWPCVIEGDPAINTQKVNSTRRMHEYDEATQAAIRKVMHEQQQMRYPKETK